MIDARHFSPIERWMLRRALLATLERATLLRNSTAVADALGELRRLG